jgi:cell volume regulation protein A
LLVAAALTFVARPLAVLLLLVPFGFTWREVALVGWVGLKGAVPIILATYPMMAGLAAGPIIFNAVFFVVIISALLQGGTLPWLARKLRLEEPRASEPPLSLEIMSLRDVDAEIIDYPVAESSAVADKLLRDLSLPEGAVVAMIARDKALIPPHGSTRLRSGDHLFVVVTHQSRDPVDAILARKRGDGAAVPGQEVVLSGAPEASDVSGKAPAAATRKGQS